MNEPIEKLNEELTIEQLSQFNDTRLALQNQIPDSTPMITADAFKERAHAIANGAPVHPLIKEATDKITSIDLTTFTYPVGLTPEQNLVISNAQMFGGNSSVPSIFHKQDRELEHRLKNLATDTILDILNNDEKRKDYDLNRIVCAAMRAPGAPMIISPRHWDSVAHSAYNGFKALYDYEKQRVETAPFPDGHEYEQGFIDRHGEFKTRQEAWHIALAAGQIIRKCGGNESKGGTLYSENLY